MKLSSRIYIFFLAIMLLIPQIARAEIEKGDIAPKLSVKKLDGEKFDLAQLKGKVVVIDFWATWCPACQEELPQLSAFYQANRSRGVEVLALSVDRPQLRGDVRQIADAYHIPAALLHDADDSGFGTPSLIPTTYVIDASGSVVAKLVPDTMPVTAGSLTVVTRPLLTHQDTLSTHVAPVPTSDMPIVK